VPKSCSVCNILKNEFFLVTNSFQANINLRRISRKNNFGYFFGKPLKFKKSCEMTEFVSFIGGRVKELDTHCQLPNNLENTSAKTCFILLGQ